MRNKQITTCESQNGGWHRVNCSGEGWKMEQRANTGGKSRQYGPRGKITNSKFDHKKDTKDKDEFGLL